MNVLTVAVAGLIGAAAGAVGTLFIEYLIPKAQPGDGFSVRWLDPKGGSGTTNFGEDEKQALERAIALSSRGMLDVEVVEIRQGRVARAQRAGQSERKVL